MTGKVRIGCSGWSYLSWRPAFYPPGTPQKKLLEAYAARLNAVEVNYTFRSLPTPSVVDRWVAQTPSSFRFACKAPQRVTHLLRLREAAAPVSAFSAALAPLAEAGKLGPILFQLPPGFRADLALLNAFLAETAPLHLQTTWEFRDPSWFVDSVYEVLASHGATLCAAESDTLRSPDLALSPALRVFRLRRSVYTTHDLYALANRFLALARGGADVYAFFKHEETPDGALRAAALLDRIPSELRG